MPEGYDTAVIHGAQLCKISKAESVQQYTYTLVLQYEDSVWACDIYPNNYNDLLQS